MSSDQSKTAHRASAVEHRETEAAGFIDLLSPVSGVLAGPGGLPGACLYRGADDASHSLIPAAFRGNPFRSPHLARERTNREQITLEFQTLIAFINAASRQGHTIPEESQSLRAELKSLQNDIGTAPKIDEWPPLNLWSVLALAQHYKVPTRMLDWSLDPYVAAYFAAKEAAKKSKAGNSKGDLVVWAFFATSLFEVNAILTGETTTEKFPIQYVTIPWVGNANARAQRAVCLAYRQFDINPVGKFEFRAYDDLLVQNLHEGLQGSPILYRLTLPKTEAPNLLRLLAFQGYDGATMFPGLEGAAKSIAESNLWPEDFGLDPRTPRSKEIAEKLLASAGKNNVFGSD
jgi:hypothetical protein